MKNIKGDDMAWLEDQKTQSASIEKDGRTVRRWQWK